MKSVAWNNRFNYQGHGRQKRLTIMQLRSNISTYEGRRKLYKAKYLANRKEYTDLTMVNVRDSLRRISYRIFWLKHRLKREIALRDKLIRFDELFTEYTNFPLSYWVKKHGIEKVLAYKYLLESGISGATIATYLGKKNTGYPAKVRKTFTQSFKTNPANRIAYNSFKAYIDKNL